MLWRRLVCLVLVGCFGPAEMTPSRDAGSDASTPSPAAPGPDDALDAGAPLGTACVPGEVRAVSAGTYAGPFVGDSTLFWQAPSDAGSDGAYWWSEYDVGLFAMNDADGGITSLDVLSTSGADPYRSGFVAGPEALYWTVRADASTAALLMRSALDGSSMTSIARVTGDPFELTPAGGRLYFLDEGHLMSIAEDGTDEQLVADIGSGTVTYAVGASQVYFTVNGQAPERASFNDHAVTALAGDAVTHGTFGPLAVGNDGYVYAVVKTSGLAWEIDALPTSGGPASRVAEGSDSRAPSTLAVDGTWLYFGTSAGLFRESSGSTEAVGPPPGPTSNIAIDSTTVWWTTPTSILGWCKL